MKMECWYIQDEKSPVDNVDVYIIFIYIRIPMEEKQDITRTKSRYAYMN
jgi:hypothetical protein